MSALEASSSPVFGGSQPLSTNFDQKPDLRAFWSSPAQTSHYGSTPQSLQPAFGNNVFGGSTPFGGSQSGFGTNSPPAFGVSTLRPSGVGTPPFGATVSQGFGGTSIPVFGSTWSPAFGDSRTRAFGSSSFPFATPTSSEPGFSSSAPSFGFASPHAFGQSNSTFSSFANGASSPPLHGFPSGAHTAVPPSGNTGFWNLAVGNQCVGSRVATYTETVAPDSFGNGNGNGNGGTVVRLMSISAMPVYMNKSPEELRYEDYLFGDKGGATPAGGSGFGISTTQSGLLNPASAFPQTSSSPFITSTSSSIFSPHTPFTYTGQGTSPSPFTPSSSPFWPSTTNPFTSPLSSPSVFGQTSRPSFISTPATSSFTFPAPSSNSAFNLTPTSSIAQTGSAFGHTCTSFWPTQTFCSQTNMLDNPSSGFSTQTNFFAPSSSSPSPSVFGKMPSPFSSHTTSAIPFSAPLSTSTSTYNSGLHNFTPSIPQTGGTFGQTSALFGQNIINTPLAAIPTSNSICFGQPAFADKQSEKDMDMDDWVLC